MSVKKPKIGADITVVGYGNCMHTTVAAIEHGFIYFRSLTGTPSSAGQLRLDDEGSTWLRGHRPLVSPEVAAAQTAITLCKPS